MSNIEQNNLTFLKYISSALAVSGTQNFPELDSVEERLLHYYATTWHLDKLTTVIEAMHATPEISPSTVHRRLKSLRKKGYIGLRIDDIDTRIKYIVQTEQCKQYFAHLGECIVSASAN